MAGTSLLGDLVRSWFYGVISILSPITILVRVLITYLITHFLSPTLQVLYRPTFRGLWDVYAWLRAHRDSVLRE